MLPNLIIDDEAVEYQNILRRLGCREHFEIHTSVTENLVDCNVLLASAPMAEAFLKAGNSAKWIQSTWAGNAGVISALKSTDTKLTGVKGIFGPLIAEYVFSYILPQARNTQRSEIAQQAQRWDYFVPGSVQGKVFVFVGTGSIGAHVAKIAQSFRMTTIGVSRSRTPNNNFDQQYLIESLDQAMMKADYVLLSLPETPESYRIVGKAALEVVKPGAMLFNVGRGSTLDIQALVDTLSEGRLSAAVLDVFDKEPLPNDSPLWNTPGVKVTPHLAAVSNPEVIANKFLLNLARFQRNEELIDVIDPLKGY